MIYDYVEYVKSLDSPNSYFRNNQELFDKSLTELTDSFICISDYLIGMIQEKSLEKRIIKIPAITDFERFYKIKENAQSENSYFLYCGAISYMEVIKFLIKSFEIIDNSNITLLIITNGPTKAINELKKIINKSEKHNQIQVLTNLKFDDLISFYTNALALLIPLRPTIKDTARFPHKISEYTASGRPIITTNIGEIKNYFIDNENAFITTNYDAYEFGEKMKFVAKNKKLAEKVGYNGRMIGEKYFDYRKYIKQIYHFIEN